MLYLWLIILNILNLFSLTSVLFILPGNWIMVITTALFAWWQKENNVFGIYTIVIIFFLAVVGEIIEFFAGAGGAKKSGAGWKGAIAAICGAIIGAMLGTILIPIPIAGTLMGSCLGAGAGTLFMEKVTGTGTKASVKAGIGAGKGQLLGLGGKFVVGIFIWLVILITSYF